MAQQKVYQSFMFTPAVLQISTYLRSPNSLIDALRPFIRAKSSRSAIPHWQCVRLVLVRWQKYVFYRLELAIIVFIRAKQTAKQSAAAVTITGPKER